MSNPPRAKGTRWESAVRKALVRVWPEVERTGSRAYELGDFSRTGRYVIEAKDHAKITLAAFMDQAKKAAARIAGSVPIVIIKRRNKSVGQAYVVYELDDWLDEREQCDCFD